MKTGLLISSALALIIVFYFWTALSNGAGIETDTRLDYPLLGRAFLQGHPDLDVKPEPELLALPDPYDPTLNKGFRLQDASLYHGKYYLYFGATPAIVLFIPYLVVTGQDFPQQLAVPIFCSLGFIFSCALFLMLIQNHFPAVPEWLKLACVLPLGMADTCPFLLRRPDVYEVAISCAYAFLQFAFLAIYYALRHPARAVPALFLASTSIGAAVGARYSYVFVGLVFAFLLIYLQRQSWHGSRKGELHLAAGAPLVIIGLLIAWYNYVRFDNPLEFGQHYQLAAISMHSLQLLRLSNVPYNLWFYFLAPPYFTLKFPFIEAFPFVWFKRPDYYFSLENVAGLFLIAPISCLALTLGSLVRKSFQSESKPLGSILVFMVLSALATLLPLLFFSGATMRYFVDFAPTLVFVGCIMVCHFYIILAQEARGKRLIYSGILLLVLMLSCSNGLLLSFSGYYNSLQNYNPETYAVLEMLFRPVEVLLQAFAGLWHGQR